MTPRTTAMTAADVRVRAKHAHTFLAALDLVNDLGTDAGITSTANVIGVLAVNASIAASDAICGLALKRRAAGDAHDEAISLLATATVNGPKYARDLGRILAVKTDVQYSPIFLSDGRAAEITRWARRLVAGMDAELEGY
jgi:hypothetical protein